MVNVQWLRIRLPMQGTWVRSLVQEDPQIAEQLSWCTERTESVTLEPVIPNNRSYCNDKPSH